MKEIVINGKFMCKKEPRGVQRYTKEVLAALDNIVTKDDNITVLIPHGKFKNIEYKNIRLKEYGGWITDKCWPNIAYQLYVLSHHALSISLSDGNPFISPGICAIHDMRFAYEKKQYRGLRKILGNRYVLLSCWFAVRFGKKIVTVSEFSKQQIVDYYHCDASKIVVLNNAWQHLKNVGIDYGIFDKFENLRSKKFFFSLGGSEPNKNLRWILNVAKRNPDELFVLAGPENQVFVVDDIDWNEIHNVIRVGYISDEEIRALMKECKAFLFPSLYEGFGIPPLEAMSMGTKVLMSNSSCLPEIYKNYVSYFDPYDYEINLNSLIEEEHPDSRELLDMYSWEKTAKGLLGLIEEIRNN